MHELRILFVDSDCDVRAVASAYAGKLPELQLVVASTAAAAVECLRREDFDVVITDCGGGGMTDAELVLRARHHKANLSVILFSSRHFANEERRMFDEQVDKLEGVHRLFATVLMHAAQARRKRLLTGDVGRPLDRAACTVAGASRAAVEGCSTGLIQRDLVVPPVAFRSQVVDHSI